LGALTGAAAADDCDVVIGAADPDEGAGSGTAREHRIANAAIESEAAKVTRECERTPCSFHSC
jgi:hypothetical protein